MSHIPLLARTTVPKLQPPRRGPQVLLACLVTTVVVLLLLPRSASYALAWNATRAPEEPPPPELARVVGAAERRQFVTQETLDDLLATVGYLAKQQRGPR